MGERGDLQVAQPEIKEPKLHVEPERGAIETALKGKLPDHPEKQDFFRTLFKDIQTQGTFTENDIKTYIQGKNLGWYRNLWKGKLPQEQMKIAIEDMDIYFKDNGGRKIIIAQEENATIQIKNNISQLTTNIEHKDTLLNARKKTQESYDKLDKTRYPEPTATEIEKQQKSIAPKTQEQLTANGLKIQDYSKFLIMEQRYGKELRKEGNTEFLDNLKEVKESLGESTTMEKMASAKNTDTIIQENKSLNTFITSSERFGEIKIPSLPESQSFEKGFELYLKFIPDKKIREHIVKNKEIIQKYADLPPKDKEAAKGSPEEKAYQEYIAAIESGKKALQERSQQLIKERVLGSCISGLATYFDTTAIVPGTVGKKEKYADAFAIDPQEGFQIQKGDQRNERNDDILSIQGKIDGKSIGFYYNLNNPEAQLQSDDFLHLEEVSDTFLLGKERKGRENLGVKLPTLQMLSAQAQVVVQDRFTEIMESAKDPEDFETSLRDAVSEALLKNYRQEALIKMRVERDIEKNMTVQTLNDIFIPDAVATEMTAKKDIDKTTEKNIRNIMGIRDKSTESMRSDELRRRRGLMKRLDPLLTMRHHENLEARRQELLQNVDEERMKGGSTDQRGSTIEEFMKRFSIDGRINLQDLEVFITCLEKKECIRENRKDCSPYFQTAEEQKDADTVVENI